MIWTKENDVIRVSADRYILTFLKDKPFVNVENKNGTRIMELFPFSSVHTLSGLDDTVRINEWEIYENNGSFIISITVNSSVWDNKTHCFTCLPDRFSYKTTVRGEGFLSQYVCFGGYYSAQIRWGTGFFSSGQHFLRGFNPEPNDQEQNYFQPMESACINMTGVPLPGKSDWFFTPAPFCFAFETKTEWMGVGAEAKPGTNRFTEYSYRGKQQFGFHMQLEYEGYTYVKGSYELPAIGFDFARDEYELLAAHAQALYDQGFAVKSAINRNLLPSWWFQPIFCSWGAQCYHASLNNSNAKDFSRQELCEKFIETLEQSDVRPGIIVLDDKWQANYGDNKVDTQKWPDLNGFIDKQHSDGKKVLLWLKAWDPENVPVDECITNAAGLPIAVDPTNPKYEKRLRESIKRMLDHDGYDADGFKIDFTARIPSGPGCKMHGDVWGLELMKFYLSIIYAEAKNTKADALIITHTPHPYLADVLDVIRLNDINLGRNVNKAMSHRAKVAAIACPDALIDTDNWPIPDRTAWRDYIKQQPTLGIPSLYYSSHIDTTGEPLLESDYVLLRDMWTRAGITGLNSV